MAFLLQVNIFYAQPYFFHLILHGMQERSGKASFHLNQSH